MPGHLLRNDLRAHPPRAVTAEGVWITDTEGKRYLDGCSGAVVSNIGHGHPTVVQAIREQAGRLTFAHRSAFDTAALTDLADRLCAFTGLDAAWFVGSGSEATEAAIQLAVQFHRERGEPRRTQFVSFRRGYHGNTLGGLSLSGNARRDAVAELVHDFPALPEPYAYRFQGGRTESEWVADLVAGARRVLAERAETLAAVVVEPVGGATMGATVPPIRYLRAIRELCDKLGLLLVADEVMSGMGRCGTPLAIDQFGVRPDIAVVGKGLGAGYTPIAAALVDGRVHEALLAGSGRVLGGHTYAGNPLSARTALAVLDVLEEEAVLERGARAAVRLRSGLQTIAARHPLVAETRGLGMLQAIELDVDGSTPQGARAQRLSAAARERGLLLYPTTGGVNDALLVAPPLTITDDELDELLARLSDAVEALAATEGDR
ncbi:aminotransferase family protein [Cumulibacter manganitolerans]|uniref:aminotransferase family protein n=1 Tax=Cumulibacter manganitolerans TaxID=1884992 RepID=UPI0012949B02|nr:aspartate aminotransferase family protein [Cumulibacter manganitolerans]